MGVNPPPDPTNKTIILTQTEENYVFSLNHSIYHLSCFGNRLAIGLYTGMKIPESMQAILADNILRKCGQCGGSVTLNVDESI